MNSLETSNVEEGFSALVSESKLIKVEDEKIPEPEKPPVVKPTLKKRKRTSRRKKTSRKIKEPDTTAAPEEEGYVPYSILDKKLVKMVAGLIPFALLATYLKDNRYLLTEAEKDFMADQWDVCISEWLPEVMSKYGSEYTLLGSMAVLIITKSGVFDGKEPVDKTLEPINAG